MRQRSIDKPIGINIVRVFILFVSAAIGVAIVFFLLLGFLLLLLFFFVFLLWLVSWNDGDWLGLRHNL